MKTIFIIISVFSVTLLQAQDVFFTSASSKLFTKEELRHLIREAAFDGVKEYQVPRAIFDSRYPQLENQLLSIAKLKITRAFTRVEKVGVGNSKGQMIEDYKQEVKIAVRDVVVYNPFFQNLVVVDQTDRILKFFSDIKVKKSGLLEVTEYITIYNGNGEQSRPYRHLFPQAERNVNDDIKHGLVRDFPTIYENEQGFRVKLPFRIKSIFRNGKPEAYLSENLKNGERLMMGTANELLPEGVHEYVIAYETSNQIAFRADKDELYWNVNGTGWAFTVDSVSSQITFPSESKIFESACYTGVQGSTEKNCVSRKLNDSTIYFVTTQSLKAYQGLTIAAAIQRGVLVPLSGTEKFTNLLLANWPIPAMILLLLSLFAVNLKNWLKYGKDPAQGTIVPRFEPPDDISPADAGYIFNQKYKPEQFSAALIDLAVKKGITIDVGKDGAIFKSITYTFKKGSNTKATLKAFAKQAYNWDIEDLYNLQATGTYNSSIESLNDHLANHLESNFKSDSKSDSDKKKQKGFFSENSNAASGGFVFLIIMSIASFFAVAFAYTNMIALSIFLLVVAGFVMQIIFYRIMSSYSREGRKMMDELLGLRMYLATAEEDRFDKLNPPEKNIVLFESLLPYAIALNCQSEWANKFETILNEAIANDTYHPGYYRGDFDRERSFSSVSRGMTSGLSSTVASSSREPSSSSSDSGGSSGGGSSGGGGGGGGGGGW